MVNIAAFTCLKRYLNKETQQLLIPAGTSFQLTKNPDVEEFAQRVFRTVAQALIDAANSVKKDLSLSMDEWPQVNKWLNSPTISHVHAGLHWVVSLGKTHQNNIGPGFDKHGLEQVVTEWLREIFPQHGSGGVVCVIDNMELLETSETAREILEQLRDRLFNLPGLRWVLCGANGVIHSLAASPRIGGYLAMPVVDVEEIAPGEIPSLIARRIREYSIEEKPTYLPIDMQCLEHLYTVANFNLRDFLALADEFSCHVMDTSSKLAPDSEKSDLYHNWLHTATTQRYQALRTFLTQSEWAILDVAMSDELKGTFGVSQFDVFNKNTSRSLAASTFKRQLAKLKKHNLITRSIENDDDNTPVDESREVYAVTSQGAMVHYARVRSRETQSYASIDWLKRVHR